MEVLLEALNKTFGEKTVLNIERGRIEHGSRTGIIGPNGAGKTTLLNIIAGILAPTSGRVLYDGEAAFPREEVSLVFQDPYLISSTVEKNISYPLKLRGISGEEAEKRIRPLMEELSLEKLRKQRPWKLSGGERQKVALARALSFRPRLLLLDEPTANIDPYTTAEIERMLLSISGREDITIVTVTHNLAQAKRMCDRIIMMHKGSIADRGSCEDILLNPRKETTRRFVEGELLI
ncbi:MAG TPA: ATP-binding cassette domain-containing protein [Candidatus Copromorpha excrementigallinarum]|uniref:ATP-binding cassette domain-containing protein n=1 Tax=Candidatus Allocopromorpha excrementigallinarum TaxID=2840742 RepID=A0A9D1I156_9FIRM|nr:ATP-binding cassette domain-containing protein [Candidatus Copromorpha excrementigallinarum]